MKKTKLLFWLTILLQIVILFGIIIKYSYVLMFGSQVILKINPVDPRDIFRGEYVILNYDLSTYYSDEEVDLKYGDSLYMTFEIDSKGYATSIKEITKNKPNSGVYLKTKVNNISKIENLKLSYTDSSGKEIITDYEYYNYQNKSVFQSGDEVYLSYWKNDTSDNISQVYKKTDDFNKSSYNDYYQGIILSSQTKTKVSLDYYMDRFFIKENTGGKIEDSIRDGESFASIKVRNGKGVVDYLIVDGKEVY